MKMNKEKYDAHMSLSHKHRKAAIAALQQVIDGDCDTREELLASYKENTKQANKHYGIAQAMFTKAYGRIQ